MVLDTSKSRRGFLTLLTAAGSAVIGAILLVPGAAYILDPVLRSSGTKGRWIRVAELANLSKDHPVTAPVVGERVDAWTKASAVRLGTVWLRVVGDEKVAAWNAECPHLDGEVQGGPAPRGMDALETRVQDGHVEVKFMRFRAQIKEKIEIG
jgi:quinol---cytochrome c reductase iron-sulfur subunit, bacillus type